MKINPVESRPLYEIGIHFDSPEEKSTFVDYCMKHATMVHSCAEEYIFWIPPNSRAIEEVHRDIPIEIKNEFVKIIEVLRKDEEDKGYLMIYII
jgi:hypothetical protein